MTTKTTGSFNNGTTPPVDAQYLNILRDEMNTLSVIDGTTLDTTGTVNSQQAQAVKAYVSQAGILCTDSGSSANSYILTASSPFTNPPLKTGTRVRFKTANSNTGSSTITPFGGSAITCKKSDGSTALTTGDIPANTEVEFVYNGTNFVQSIGRTPATTTTQGIAFLSNPITIAFNGTTQMDIGAGIVNYDNGSGQLLCQAITKTLQASGSWTAGTNQNGLDTGARANSTWYNIFEIVKNSDNTSDILYSTSRTAPTVPSGYTLVAWIGAIRTDASSNIDQNYLAKRTNFGQIHFVKNASYLTGTTLLPLDNTNPQNTEGDQYMSTDFVALSDKSILEIDVDISLASSATATLSMGLFQDSILNALRAKPVGYVSSSGATYNASMKHLMKSTTTSSTAFKVRAGSNSAGTTYFNGNGAGLFNGTCFSSITIKEYL